jgi:hypothetical protein
MMCLPCTRTCRVTTGLSICFRFLCATMGYTGSALLSCVTMTGFGCVVLDVSQGSLAPKKPVGFSFLTVQAKSPFLHPEAW